MDKVRQRITINDVAREAGVSRATVGFVLSKHKWPWLFCCKPRVFLLFVIYFYFKGVPSEQMDEQKKTDRLRVIYCQLPGAFNIISRVSCLPLEEIGGTP